MSTSKQTLRGMAILPLAALAAGADAQINYWTGFDQQTQSNPGFWSPSDNWSLGTPSAGQTLEIGARGYSTPAFTVLDGGTYTVAGLISSSSFLYQNGGSLTLTAVAAANTIDGYQNIGGSMADSGQLTITGALTNTGSFNLLTGANLNMSDGQFENLGSFTGKGAMGGADSIDVDNGSTGVIQLSNGSAMSFGDMAGQIDNEGSVSVDNSQLFMSAETFTSSGKISLTSGAQFTSGMANALQIGLPTERFSNNGDIVVDHSTWDDWGSVTNQAMGTITIKNGGSLNQFLAYGGFSNAGIVTVNGSVGGATFAVQSFSNSGTLTATNATLFTNSYFSNSGSINLTSSSWGDQSANVDNASSGIITLKNSSISFDQDNGVSNEGSIVLDNSQLFVEGFYLTNFGTLTLKNGSSENIWQFANSGAFWVDGTSYALLAQGTGYVQTGASSLSKIDGTLDLEGGTLTLGTGVPGDGGTLGGSGTILGSVDNVSGQVVPGDPQVLHIAGDYVQEAKGVSIFNIAGLGGPGEPNGYDQIAVGGNLKLAGTVDVTSSVPLEGNQSFKIFTYGGSFSVSSTLGIFDTSDPSVHLTLFSVSGPNGGSVYLATPEPSSFVALCALGIPTLLRRRLRRYKG